VSDYIRQHYGQTTLHALTQEQLQNMLQLLQNGQLSIPQPQQRQPTLRPLLPAEHNTLNQQVSRLAAATGEPGKLIWQSMLELCGVKTGELIPATHFTPLSYWLQARQTLSAQSAPTLTSAGGAEAAAGSAGVAKDRRFRPAQLARHAANGVERNADSDAAE
jgi:hypothetical protein